MKAAEPESALMPIDLNEDRRADFKARLRAMFRSDFDEDLSDFRADEIMGLFLTTLGPAVYNQAVQDVRAHLQGKLDDLEGDVYADG